MRDRDSYNDRNSRGAPRSSGGRSPSRDRDNYGNRGDGNRGDDRNSGRGYGGRGSGDRGNQRRSGGPGGSSDRYNSRGRSGGYRQGFRGGQRSDIENDNGNGRERIAVESGCLVFLDQFMLANSDFVNEYSKVLDESSEVKNGLLNYYGGVVVNLEPGTYRIERNPFEYSILIYPEYAQVSSEELKGVESIAQGTVYVDTRCIAMIDRELLDDTSLLKKYQQLWTSGQDKSCRDLLRDNGGAVRYGFSRDSDDLEIYLATDRNIVGLWPILPEEDLDNTDSQNSDSQDSADLANKEGHREESNA